jgi:hypothetical protein
MADEAATHSIETTTAVLRNIKELVEADDETELDLYEKMSAVNAANPLSSVRVKVDNDEDDLSYWLILEPIDE